MARLDEQRQKELEPERIEYAQEQLRLLGFQVESFKNRLEFVFNGYKVQFWPYSGWHSGKTIQDGRGITNLLKQLKQ